MWLKICKLFFLFFSRGSPAVKLFFFQVWLKCHNNVFYHSLNEAQLDAAADGSMVILAFSVLDQTVMKRPHSLCLYGRCFLVSATINSTPF